MRHRLLQPLELGRIETRICFAPLREVTGRSMVALHFSSKRLNEQGMLAERIEDRQEFIAGAGSIKSTPKLYRIFVGQASDIVSETSRNRISRVCFEIGG